MPARECCARLFEIYPSSACAGLGRRSLGYCLLHAHGFLHQLVSLFLAPIRLGDVRKVRVDVDEETVRVARLEELGSELVELPRPAPVAEVVEDPREDE